MHGKQHVLALEHAALPKDGPVMVSGANGAGKSTLLAVLGGLITPSGGRVDVLGTRVWPAAETARLAFRRRVVMCETEPLFFRGTVAPPADWNAPGFDDAAWENGPTGIGYGDGDGGCNERERPAGRH